MDEEKELHNGLIEDEEETKSFKIYKDSTGKLNDLKSSAFSFVFIGILGILFLSLKAANIIPLNFDSTRNLFMNIVLGIVFLAVLITGLIMYKKSQKLKAVTKSEIDLSQSVTDWFYNTYTSEQIDTQIDFDSGTPAYFARIEFIQSAIQNNFCSLDSSFIEYLAEEIYQKFYQD